MVGKVELIPLSEGNRITVKENEKVIVGRGSSLGCNEKKISRHHAELLLKDDQTLWIKPTHANPVFYRPPNGKTIQLPKDIERELHDGDQIGLLPSSFFFRVSFSIDVNNNKGKHDSDSDSDSTYEFKKEKEEKSSPIRTASPDRWSPSVDYRRSTTNQVSSVFDFDDDIIVESIRIPNKPMSIDKKPTEDIEMEAETKSDDDDDDDSAPVPSVSVSQISAPTSPVEDDGNESESNDSNLKSRKLPKWMAGLVRSPAIKPATTTPKPSYSRSSSYTTSTSAKRNLAFDDDNNADMNEVSNSSDIRSSITTSETKSPGKVLSRIPPKKSFGSDIDDGFDAPTIKSPPPTKKVRSSGRRRPSCQFGPSCYRKNPAHRAELSHPGDSDYEDSKPSKYTDDNDDDDIDKPQCPFGKTCYRQNPQHKRDFKH